MNTHTARGEARARQETLSPMRAFDPRRVAHCEKEAWVAYYQRRWLSLMRWLVELVRATFGLSLWQAIYIGFPLTRAQIAFAPKDNDVPLAIAYMRKFYAFVQRVHREDFDPDEAARLDVNWWVIHRRLFGQTENQELVDALTQLYAAIYKVDPASVCQAAYHRAQAMIYSDRWVTSERDENSPLLAREEEELVTSYAALRQAVAVKD